MHLLPITWLLGSPTPLKTLACRPGRLQDCSPRLPPAPLNHMSAHLDVKHFLWRDHNSLRSGGSPASTLSTGGRVFPRRAKRQAAVKKWCVQEAGDVTNEGERGVRSPGQEDNFPSVAWGEARLSRSPLWGTAVCPAAPKRPQWQVAAPQVCLVGREGGRPQQLVTFQGREAAVLKPSPCATPLTSKDTFKQGQSAAAGA